MTRLIGHTKISDKFLKLAKANKVPQTMIFYGLPGIGKKLVAKHLVNHLFCNNNQGNLSGCGSCQACHMLKEDSHPDFFTITPTPPKSQQTKNTKTTSLDVASNWTIKTEQFQALRQKLIHYPLMANHQIVLIDDAERMTTTTANSLLKILEEPREHQIFILIASQLNKLLPTIRSRALKYYFSPLNTNEACKIIKEQCEPEEIPNDSTLEFLTQAFQGSITNTLKAIKTGFDWTLLNHIFKSQASFTKTANMAKTITQSNIDLSIFLQCLRQACLNQYKTNPLAKTELIAFFDKIKKAESQLTKHIQKDFILENLFM